MRKVEPKTQAFLICCLLCLFAFNVQAQQIKNTVDTPMSTSKKNLADQKNVQIDIPQNTSQSFEPTPRPATATQLQRVEVLSNSSLTKTMGQKKTVEAQSNVVVDYNPTPVKMTLQQLQQIKLNDGRDHRVQPPIVNTPNLKSVVCGGEVTFDDPSICSTPPVLGANISIVVDAFECTFSDIPEIDNGDGTLTVAGLAVFVDPNGANMFLGVVLESETFNTTACSTMPLMVPPNLGCVPTFTEFAAITNTFVVDAVTGVISSATTDDECPVEFFTVTINPNLTAEVVTDEGAACGTLTAALVAEDGTQCVTATATCLGPDDVPSITFNYPFPDPVDGTTYQECPPTQTITGVPCTGCPCGGEVDYEDTTACSADLNGDGSLTISATELACMISPEIDNGDGTLTVYSFDIYSPDAATGGFLTSLFESATFSATACNSSLDISYPINTGCDPAVFQFEVVVAINVVDAATGEILSFENDTSCDGTEIFSVTVNPTLTAGIVDDQGAACGTLTAALFAEDGTACPGTEMTAMCINFGDMPSVTLVDPYGCADAASLEITGASCENCECGGIVDYGDVIECSADLNGDGTLDVVIPEVGCNFNAETVNADGSLTVYSSDVYIDDGAGNLGYLTSFFESATFASTACVGDLTALAAINQTCEAAVTTYVIITAINQIAPDGTVMGFVDDPSCTPEVFTVTINPTLTAQITADDSADCGSFTAALFAEDGTQCAGTEMTSADCAPDSGDGMSLEVVLADPFGCADAASLTIAAECDGCFPIMCTSDGCKCFPDGIDSDGDGINDLALVEIMIEDSEAGKDWILSVSSGLLNPDGTPTTAMVVDNGDGTYTITAYVNADGSTHSATFTNTTGDDPCVFESESCLPCPPPLDEVPTVGEWGLIMLGLLMTITAIVGIRARREEDIYA